jgi:thiol-disulfide isomerase/thioredoxin
MLRRQFLSLVALAGLAAVPAFANDVSGLDAALNSGAPVMIHVTAPWCGTCQIQKPIVAELLKSPDFKNFKKFEIDFDEQQDVLAKFRVQSQSTIIVYNGGKEIDRTVGETDRAVIEALMRKAL